MDWQLPGDEMAEHAAVWKLLADKLPLQGTFCDYKPRCDLGIKAMGDGSICCCCSTSRGTARSQVCWWYGEVSPSWILRIRSWPQLMGMLYCAPRTSLQELVAVLRQGAIFVSSDTGPDLHMSVAVGTPSIGLYGATRPADCGPYGAPHVGIQVRYESGSRNESSQGGQFSPCERYRLNVSVVNVISCLMPLCVR